MIKSRRNLVAICTIAMVFVVYYAADAQPAKTPPPFAGAAPTVLDADNNVLGTVVGISSISGPYDGVLIFINGYFVRVNLDGAFPIAAGSNLWWTAPRCAGDVYWRDSTDNNAITGTNILAFSAASNSFWAPSGTQSVAVSVPGVQVMSSESAPGCSLLQFGEASAPGILISGWQLSRFDVAKTLGWNVSGNPLHLSGPLKFR